MPPLARQRQAAEAKRGAASHLRCHGEPCARQVAGHVHVFADLGQPDANWGGSLANPAFHVRAAATGCKAFVPCCRAKPSFLSFARKADRFRLLPKATT